METDNDATKGFEFIWIIHNFNFCWHKTGEELESPTFWMNYPSKMSWKIRLYPRGEYDGEYISCYLCREKDGPEIVNVDFQLFLRVGDSGEFEVRPPVSFSKIYSFKPSQMEGLACFASRREIFALTASRKERLTLSVRCRIIRVNEIKMDGIRHFGRTTIETERISGTEVFDDPSELEPENCNDVDVKPLLKEKPFIGINVSYLQETLVIEIHPKSCDGIKYAICKTILVSELTNEPPIEYVRCWIGGIKEHIWTYKLPCQEAKSAKSSSKFILSEALMLHYDFEFSTGVESLSSSLDVDDYQKACNLLTASRGYLKTPNFTLSEYLNKKANTTTCAPTAMDALKSLCTSGSFRDFVLKVETPQARLLDSTTHKALLCVRSAKSKSMIKEINVICGRYCGTTLNVNYGTTDLFEIFLSFLYTDSVEIQSVESAIGLYVLASHLKVEMLIRKCRLYLTDNLHFETAGYVLELANKHRDSSMKTIAENYIITYLDLVHNTGCWSVLTERNPQLVIKTLLLKYKRKNDALKLNED